jgi:hypothetical protein
MTMQDGAFDLLKAGHDRPESARQPEIRLAGFPKILSILFRSPGRPIHARVLNRALALILG